MQSPSPAALSASAGPVSVPAVVALNVMARDRDDHTKNFSFILKQGGSWELLAPAYDVTHGIAY